MLEVLTWTATGLGTGWLVRTVMRSRRDFGVLGDLITGWLGGIIGGWLFARLGFNGPENAAGHVVVAVVGAATLLVCLRLLRQVTQVTQATVGAAVPSAMDLEEGIRRLGALERNIIESLLLRQRWTRDPNQAFDAQTTFGQRLADKVAQFGGSWTFIGLFAAVLMAWMALNQQMFAPFDPYPYILLNLVLSCLAALQAPIIMMSQNRQSAKDRSDARNDYEVNVRAEMEIVAVHTKLDLLREREWQRLTDLVVEQQRMLGAIEKDLAQLVESRGESR